MRSCMADKGFLIQDMLAPLGVRLNVPPILKSKSQMAAEDVILTKKIAQLRIHIERAIGRVKEFRILQVGLCQFCQQIFLKNRRLK